MTHMGTRGIEKEKAKKGRSNKDKHVLEMSKQCGTERLSNACVIMTNHISSISLKNPYHFSRTPRVSRLDYNQRYAS